MCKTYHSCKETVRQNTKKYIWWCFINRVVSKSAENHFNKYICMYLQMHTYVHIYEPLAHLNFILKINVFLFTY